jgi:hypothetical protein
MSYEAQRYIDDQSDLAQRLRLSTILQALSPALAPGSDYPEARAGDFLLAFEDSSEKLVPRAQGVVFVPVASVEYAVEWPADRGSRGAPIEHHDIVPLDAQWIVGPDGRKACLRPNGNRVEKTVYVHMLVDGFKTTIALKSMSYSIGQDFGRDADKVRVNVDGEVVRVCGALWKMTSELERKNSYTWYSPRFERLGVLGQPNGPSLDLVRMAKTLRFEFKIEETKRKAERAALAQVKPTPALGRTGSISITSGIDRPRSWADPRGPEIVDPPPAEQPAKTIDDDIPF